MYGIMGVENFDNFKYPFRGAKSRPFFDLVGAVLLSSRCDGGASSSCLRRAASKKVMSECFDNTLDTFTKLKIARTTKAALDRSRRCNMRQIYLRASILPSTMPSRQCGVRHGRNVEEATWMLEATGQHALLLKCGTLAPENSARLTVLDFSNKATHVEKN